MQETLLTFFFYVSISSQLDLVAIVTCTVKTDGLVSVILSFLFL